MLSYRTLRRLSRLGVSRRKLRGTLAHRWLGDRLFSKDLWKLRRGPVARGWLIGALVGATPMVGLQLVIGIPAALWFRANLFLVVFLICLTNPATVVFYYPFAYLVGCWFLGRPAGDFDWRTAPVPFFLGSFLVGSIVGLVGFALTYLLWRERPIAKDEPAAK